MSAAPALLKNVATGRVFVWTAELAERPNMRVMDDKEAAEHLASVKRAAAAREAAEPKEPTREDLIRQLVALTGGLTPEAAALTVAEVAVKAAETPKRTKKKAEVPAPPSQDGGDQTAGGEQGTDETGQPSDGQPSDNPPP
ncbi:MAG TPA: hypothetical protein PLP22_00325 [Candidatus Competibacter sp.]|nr:hypothetical protein [Candidatus Competibacter sp.]